MLLGWIFFLVVTLLVLDFGGFFNLVDFGTSYCSAGGGTMGLSVTTLQRYLARSWAG